MLSTVLRALPSSGALLWQLIVIVDILQMRQLRLMELQVICSGSHRQQAVSLGFEPRKSGSRAHAFDFCERGIYPSTSVLFGP